MIEINLLPEESKVKTRWVGKINIDAKYLLSIALLAFGVLILVHICLAVVGIVKTTSFKALNSKWKELAPQREILSEFKKEYDISTSDAKIIQELNSRRLNWSEKCNRLSLDLPAGIWFNEIIVSRKEFTLKASVVSLQKKEMSLINRFINSLKNDTRFFKDFNSLELGLVQKKSIGAYDVVDFMATAKLKEK